MTDITPITPAMLRAHRQALIGSTIDHAIQRERLAEIEFELDATRDWLAEQDAEWLAQFDQRRDDPLHQLDEARLAGMVARLRARA